MKLFQILDAIPRKELNAADKFLQSPYFNQKETLVLLFRLLRPWHGRFQRLNKHEVYQQLKPHQVFHAKWWNDHCSELGRLLETFLQMQYLKNNPDQHAMLKRSAMQAYGLEKQFIKLSKSIVAHYESAETLLPIQHFQLWECCHDLYIHSSAADERIIFEQKAQKQLDLYYWIQKLSLQANITSGTQSTALAIDPDYLQAIIRRVDQLPELPYVLQSYRNLIRFFEEGLTIQSYQIATTDLMKSPPDIDIDEAAFLLMVWCNLGSRQFALGKLDFIQPVFRLYQYGIRQGLFLQPQGTIPGNIFINVCIMAAQAKETAWLEDFFRYYSPKLELYLKDETLALCHAFVAFHQLRFRDAKDMLDNISSTDLQFRIRLHSLSVRCLLELHLINDSYHLVLTSKVRAFKRMVRSKKKLRKGRIQAYLNFADVTLDIAKLNTNRPITPSAFSMLYQKLESTTPLALGSWLRQKLQQLEPPPLA